MSNEDRNFLGDRYDDAQRYRQIADSKVYPILKKIRSPRTKSTARSLLVALSTGTLLYSSGIFHGNEDTVVDASPQISTPATTTPDTSQSLSTVTSAPTTPRNAQSTIDVRNGFSLGSEPYKCEDLRERLVGTYATCSATEQLVFDDNKAGLESAANSPKIFAAFPTGYEPVDRVALALGVCVEFYNGSSVAEATAAVLDWYPSNEFSAEQLATNSLRVACPSYR